MLVLVLATSGNEQKQGSSKKFRASHLGQAENAIGFRFSVFEYEHENSRGEGQLSVKLRHAAISPPSPPRGRRVGDEGTKKGHEQGEATHLEIFADVPPPKLDDARLSVATRRHAIASDANPRSTGKTNFRVATRRHVIASDANPRSTGKMNFRVATRRHAIASDANPRSTGGMNFRVATRRHA